jgi:hypothetical protein
MPASFTESDLGQFYGTEQYYRHWTGKLVYTDGIHFLVGNGAAWLVDAVASYQHLPKLNTGMLADFQVWELKVKDGKATLTCKADSGHKPVVTQEIEYTDFPLADIKLYVEAGAVGDKPAKVLLLPSER